MPDASALIVAFHVSRIHEMQGVHPPEAGYHTKFTISDESALIEELPFEKRKERAKALSTRRPVWSSRNGQHWSRLER